MWHKFIWHEIWTLGVPGQFCIKLLPALDFVKHRGKNPRTWQISSLDTAQTSSFMATLMWVTVPGRSTHRGPWVVLLGGAVDVGPSEWSLDHFRDVPCRNEDTLAPSFWAFPLLLPGWWCELFHSVLHTTKWYHKAKAMEPTDPTLSLPKPQDKETHSFIN